MFSNSEIESKVIWSISEVADLLRQSILTKFELYFVVGKELEAWKKANWFFMIVDISYLK